MFRYQTLANNLEAKIKDGTYGIGEKLPSIRSLSHSLNLSITTVLGAYRHLEDLGLVRSRPKSGYYIQPQQVVFSDEMLIEELPPPKEIPFSDLMQKLLAETSRPELLKLSLAQPEPDVLPTEALNRIFRRILRTPNLRTTDYLDPQGLLSLRVKIARLMLDRGVNISAKDILVTNGCQQALRLSLECVAEEGDIIVVETPCYPGLLHAAAELGMQIIEVPSRNITGIDLALLATALQNPDVKAVFLNPTCANPNGSTIPAENRMAIVELAQQNDVFIIEDDTNRDLFFGSHPPASLKSYDKKAQVLFCGSFSKTLGPGMRVGWMIPGPFMAKALARKYIDDLGGPSMEQHVLSQFAATSLYRKTIEKTKRLHFDTVSAMVKTIQGYFPEGTHVQMPTGGFLLWVKLPDGMSAENLRREALAHKISVAPGGIFSGIKTADKYIRIGWGGKWGAQIERTVKKLGAIMEKMLRAQSEMPAKSPKRD